MRIWLLALAGCWTGQVDPPAQTPVAHAHRRTTPNGYFVPDLVAHRLETNAIDQIDGQRAALTQPFLLIQPQNAIAIGIGLSPVPTATPAFGDFLVEYCIDINGRVMSAHVERRVNDQGPQYLQLAPPSDRSALDKMRGWRFTPYFVGGKPVTACSFIDYTAL